MGFSSPRHRRVKLPAGRIARRKRTTRNEKICNANRFGKPVVAAFLGIVFIGYVLVFGPSIHVTVSSETAAALGAALSGAALRLVQTRRHRH
ncbi:MULTISPECIES: hypothetical protein [Streptomyces]|uniref:hypothetical protein n=1 Tax=Streptomyces TaxID=1883 RepID=UPI00055F1161|nr:MULTISPECIES: hypothetical protein [Streptomyces]AOW90862.1 hypothetical protein BC342_34945 [Streptomyces olivaceus]MBZ6114224.1 hypothetical protein [Streptomyces olivaceus]MBZ6128329.1 hypothetical protein [Streptomyces olivaceus]MBZ6135496.1 hypothetical protein [Streptomyces olivaceus]MBZ6148828.1 hypothetical protein [Streptomyces olivaceus]